MQPFTPVSDRRRDSATEALKVPPHSLEAEQSVLGGLMLDNNAWEQVADRLTETDFYRGDHKILFQAIAHLARDGRPFDVVTLVDWLENRNQLDTVGGIPYLATLARDTPSAANIAAYAEIVRERSVLRQLIQIGNEIANSAYNPQGQDSAQLLDEAEKKVFAIAEQGRRSDQGFTGINELLTKAVERIDELFQRDNPVTGLATGWNDFDELTAGLQPGDLVIIAGRPSMGKAQPLDARILMAHGGWKTMGELQVGDALASLDGAPSQVAGLFPQGEKQIYRVHFSDGRHAECCAEHLWRVHYRDWPAARVLSTAKIADMLTKVRYRNRLWIDYPNGSFGSDATLPVDPWVLGRSLGGSEPTARADSSPWETGDIALIDRPLQQARIATSGVSYLHANRQTRLDVLRGLLDQAGDIGNDGSIRLSMPTRSRAQDIAALVRSLGGWCAVSLTSATDYVCHIHHPDPSSLFLLSEKQTRLPQRWQRRKRLTFSCIEPTRRAQAQCIAVTHPSQLYITDDYVVTHNTTLAINIAEHAAIKVRCPVAVFSMEMPGDHLAMRMMSSLGSIDQQRIRTGKLEDDDWPRLTSAISMLNESKFFIDDSAALSPNEVRARARRLHREHGQLGLIVIDYIQLMRVPGSAENRATEVAEISRSLKALAKDLHVPVIALSQLNRSLEQRSDKRPVMSDLRESGAIEQDADLICFIYRDEVYNPESADKGTAEIIVAKQRNGPIGTVRLTFMGQYTRFESFAPDMYRDGGYE